MPGTQNNRRRFLAFMGLLGAPAALWSPAKAQTSDSTSLTCNPEQNTYDYVMHYTQDFDVSGGALSPMPGDSLVIVDKRPSQIGFLPPYKAGRSGIADFTDPITGMGGFDGTDGMFTLSMNGTVTAPTFKAYVIIPEDSDTHTFQAQPAIADAPDGLAMIDAIASSQGRGQYAISGDFAVDLLPTLRTNVFDLTIVVDGKAAGSYRYDFTQVPWLAFQKYQDDEYAEATDVTVDADGNASLDECTASDCFFTTAAVGTLGLSDDCWELRTLRAFRDGPLAKTPEGRALTLRYYAEAPRLVRGINARRDAEFVWLQAYWTHILPCAVMARTGLNASAVAHYRRLFERLERFAAT